MFTMLATRSDFSVTESILKTKQAISEAQRVGAKAVGMIDTMSLTSMIDFQQAALKAGIKPITGARLRLVDDPAWRKPPKKDGKVKPQAEYFVSWYVLSEAGLKALYKLLSLANDEIHFYFTPRLSFADFFAALDTVTSEDVAVVIESAHSVALHPDALTLAGKIKASVSASNAFVALSPVNTPYFDTMNKKQIELGRDANLEFIVTRPVFYKVAGADALETFTALYKNELLTSIWHPSPSNRDMHAMTEAELTSECIAAATRLSKQRGITGTGAHFLRGCTNTSKLIDLVKYGWTKQTPSLPAMAPDEFEAVKAKCLIGWKTRFTQNIFGHRPDAKALKEIYQPRLMYELEVLKRLNFSGYFLLTEDVVNYAKANKILVGPGRGSVAGSLVAYLLGITDCDPLRFGLLFERFINPDRLDLPDADLDFMASRREEIFAYLIRKYGQDYVAGVSNFNEIGTASAINDVSKAFGTDAVIYRNVSKLVPKKHGAMVSLTDSADQVAEIARFRDKNGPTWQMALELEGTTRTLGQHAAGAIVGGVPLVERAVIERRKGNEKVVNWDKNIVELQGLVKLDILGLLTLDVIDLATKYIGERHGKHINLKHIPLDDEKVLANFAKGNTTAIFQFESGGMKKLLRDLGTSGMVTFEDITAATALYRPGPMESGMMDSFAKRKQGLETVDYPHELLEPVLKETYGVWVYQEEVMQTARVIAGYTASEADILRKIMGKKLPAEMEKQRDKFVTGCINTIGAEKTWANNLFETIAGFAGYGFNKSHSTTYAMISYQAMYLKTYFPVEYFAACLTLMGEDKLPGLISDATQNYGLKIELPNVNQATGRFEILTDTQLMIPFHRIKGMSEKVADAIVTARGRTPFTSEADFIARVDKRLVNIAKRGALEKIGAFASIDHTALAIDHPSRIKDQRELIPNLITTSVPIGRDMQLEAQQQVELEKLYAKMLGDEAISSDGVPVRSYVGEDAQFMIVMDAPSREEEAENMMFLSSPNRRPFAVERIQEALDHVGISVGQTYWTALIKRPKAGKQITASEQSLYAPYLDKEITIVKPPIIVLMGTAAVRAHLPDFKGRAADEAGTIVYDPIRDCNLVIGFGPGELYYAPEKMENLIKVFESVATLI